MRSTNTFGVHFIIRPNQKGTHTLYARISVNKSKSELGLKRTISKDDWNAGKGAAKPKTPELKQLNSYLEEVRAKMVLNLGEWADANQEKLRAIIEKKTLKAADHT